MKKDYTLYWDILSLVKDKKLINWGIKKAGDNSPGTESLPGVFQALGSVPSTETNNANKFRENAWLFFLPQKLLMQY